MDMLVKALVLGSAFVSAGAIAAAASGDGLPVLGIDVGTQGVAARTAPVRYVTLRGAGETIVARTARVGGRVLRFATVPGTFTIPAVAYDGSSSGLSADAGTLVLIEPRTGFPRARTTFAVMDARRLRLRRVIDLRGDFSFDAISPGGRTLYLIQYTSRFDPTKYSVRAYDLSAGRLFRAPVVHPHEHGDEMRGSPLTRATSPGGRWAYTLYDGGGMTPFVHALDTARRRARCIDLPVLAGRRDLSQLRLGVEPGGVSLTVRTPQRTLAVVDLASFRVVAPAVGASGGDRDARLLAAVLAVASASALALGRRRLRNRSPHLPVRAD